MDASGSPVLLLVGKDLSLLRTRRAVLRTAGFAVLLAGDASDALAAARSFHFQAVLVCHTFEPCEQEQIAGSLHTLQSSLPVISLIRNWVEPENLIRIVREATGVASSPVRTSPTPVYISQFGAQ